MKQSLYEKPDYGNWVSTQVILVPAAIGFIFMGLATWFPILFVLAAIPLLGALYFAYARYLFSSRGGRVQDLIRGLVLSNLTWNGEGKLLDIGCGNGPLAIELAKRCRGARVVGIDSWGRQWAYSKTVCEKNAELEGVAERVTFQKAGAASLPFEDESFDAVVSNLVFHEVRGVKDKRDLIREALRVVKKGGRFALQDLFLWKPVYGEPDELMATIRNWGVSKAELLYTNTSALIPTVLKLPFMVGRMGMIVGEK